MRKVILIILIICSTMYCDTIFIEPPLEFQGYKEFIPIIKEISQTTGEWDRTKKYSYIALGQLGDETVIPQILEDVQNNYYYKTIKIDALNLFGKFKTKSALEYLNKLLKEEKDEEIEKVIQKVIKEINKEK